MFIIKKEDTHTHTHTTYLALIVYTKYVWSIILVFE